MRSQIRWGCVICLLLGMAQWGRAGEAVALELVGDWQIRAALPGSDDAPPVAATLNVPPPQEVTVTAERHGQLPLYNPQGPQYSRGAKLNALYAGGLTAPDLLDPASLVVRAGPEETSQQFERGQDYEFEDRWGGIGRVPGSHIGENQPVFISYRYTPSRIDSIVLTSAGKLAYRIGEPAAETPQSPKLAEGEQRLANVWIPNKIDQLTENNLFPITETEYPEPAPTTPSVAEERLPKTMAKLRSGKPVRILAWGDSVTDAGYLADRDRDRWQEQFVARLRERFPQARIELVTEAWGGRNTNSYLNVPPGEPHNYQETVLDAQPDLIVSEFVNDAGLNPAAVEQRYSKLLADFQKIGAEWIILTPHYVRPDWMALDRQRDIDDDPRPYVKGLRQFAEKHHVALADAALRYGRLWRQGIPYNSLMTNCINHPDARGMKIFADALMQLFPQK